MKIEKITKTAFVNGILLDGTLDMEPVHNQVILVEEDKIKKILSKEEWEKSDEKKDYKEFDLNGKYVMPGLINMHVHLAGNGKPQKKQRNNEALVKAILSTKLTRKIAYRMVCNYAKLELLSGVTTIRTVGGISDFDTKCRDEINIGKIIGPSIIASNEGISVPGGHMAGSVAVAAETVEDALAQVDKAAGQNANLIKLMVTGGVLDAKEKGVPGVLKMKEEMISAVCNKAHKMGFKVAAHVESPEGVKAALKNGVDSIEHGAKPDEEMISLFKEKNAFVCTTISPALPYALFDSSISHASEVEKYNGNIVFEGIISCAKAALENNIPVALGNDVGCPYITQYDFWRELFYFHKFCGVTNSFALHTATQVNAELCEIGNFTGSITEGKNAEMIVTEKNPLDDLRNLRKIEYVISKGRIILNPKYNRRKEVEQELNKFC